MENNTDYLMQPNTDYSENIKDEPLFSATPQELPPPTYFPFFVAMGTTFVFWGLVTSYWISAIGLLIFAIGIRGWIFDLINEKTANDE